ncbi:MAG TPA: toprim domain-containing protein [Bryobacteraceae bacterium]|nr:toprim domain-containing protein [Bryobacteraceae bacterium]
MTVPPMDVHAYYRQVTDIDIGEIARELLAGRIIQESRQTLFCDCPNHRSQSHRSLHIWLDKQGWYCHACGVGGDVLQLVEFVQHGVVTKGQTGPMPDSHRQARDFLAARAGLPPLSKLASGDPEKAEDEYRLTLRVREALTVLAELYHERLMANAEVLGWFRSKYGIGEETIARLKVGFADNFEPSVARALMDGPHAFTLGELTATSAFRPTLQDGIVPFFDGRIVFPYWSRGQVVFMIGRRTDWTSDVEWEKSKYKKLAVRNDRDHKYIAPCIRNDVLYNEDVLLTRPERIIITEGVTDCISLMEHGFPVVSPVTTKIRDSDWERLIPKLRGVKTVFVCQDNEVSEAGMQGALKTARILAGHGIATRVAVLPLGEKQRAAREKLANLPPGSPGADELEADAKIDVNEFFAAGQTAADFEAILASAQTPLEMAISTLNSDITDTDLSRLLEPILAEVGGMSPIERERHLRLIQARCGKSKLPVSILRQQMKVVVLDDKTRRKHGGRRDGARGNDSAGSGPGGQSALPRIQINDRQLREIVSDAWAAVHRANEHGASICPHTPFLFHRAGKLVRLAVGESGPEIDEMDEDAVFGLLARTADWHKSGEDSITETSPPRDAARDMLAYPDLHLPMLEGVISTPVFGHKGDLIVNEGYHKNDRLWLSPDPSLELQPIPDEPSPEDITAARELLFGELLVDFPFVDASDRAHAVAAMILPFIRRIIDGPTPMHLIEAPTMGSGKGLLANLISIVATGAVCEARTLPENEDEVRKMVTAELMKGRPIVLLDNASDRRQLYSSSLASVLTSVRWTDRKLGQSAMASVPNNALWMMTANNPNLHLELTRRCIRLRIDPRVDRPWKRTSFKHPEITTWAKESRSALVGGILTLIRAWMVAGRPLDRARLGSFERWSTVMGGILNVAGISGFLANLDQLYEAADQDGQAWRAFTAAWWEAFRDQPKKVSELNQFCEERELMLKLRGDGSLRSQQIRLGNALTNCRDRSFNGLCVVRLDEETKHKGVSMYALVAADSGNWGCWGSFGDVADKHPPESTPADSEDYKLLGDVGDVGAVPSRVERDFCASPEEGEDLHARACKGTADNIPKIPNIPKFSATDCNESTNDLGMLEGNIPKTSPSRSDIPKSGRARVDLADFDDGSMPPSRGRS